MDELQRQIIELTHKIDNLYEIVEQIKGQMTYNPQETHHSPKTLANVSMIRSSSPTMSSRMAATMEHKDILVEGNPWSNNSSSVTDNNISCDLQVRRLTAQLTAAYNRIAALEEQLLASRIHETSLT